MAHNSEIESKLRQYFLGELTFEEQVLVEQRLFLDSEYAEIAQGVEDDLIDDFLHNDLTTGDQLRFEGRFIKRPGREMDLRIAEALGRYIAPDSFVAPHAEQLLYRPRHTGTLREARSKGIIVGEAEGSATTHSEQSASTSTESSRQNTARWLLLAVVILIILCLIVWFAVRQ